jgi:hypothetical protein
VQRPPLVVVLPLGHPVGVGMGRLFVGAGFVLDLGRPWGPLVGVPLAALQPLQLEVVGDAVVFPRRHQSPHVRREGYVDAGGQLGGPRRRRGFGSLAGPGALGVEPEVGEETVSWRASRGAACGVWAAGAGPGGGASCRGSRRGRAA